MTGSPSQRQHNSCSLSLFRLEPLSGTLFASASHEAGPVDERSISRPQISHQPFPRLHRTSNGQRYAKPFRSSLHIFERGSTRCPQFRIIIADIPTHGGISFEYLRACERDKTFQIGVPPISIFEGGYRTNASCCDSAIPQSPIRLNLAFFADETPTTDAFFSGSTTNCQVTLVVIPIPSHQRCCCSEACFLGLLAPASWGDAIAVTAVCGGPLRKVSSPPSALLGFFATSGALVTCWRNG